MSEQEKKSGGQAAGGTPVVMVESAGSRHKQPYRPTELQESSPDLHHKRSRAPAVPSVTEDLKEATETPEVKERKESERAMSSEKTKHSLAKKLSSSVKRREPSPEAITLAPLEVDTKLGTTNPAPQPIPAQVASVASAASDLLAAKAEAEKKTDDDSITEEIADLRTPKVDKRASEWLHENECDENIKNTEEDSLHTVPLQKEEEELNEEIKTSILQTSETKKKEISWDNKKYRNKLHLQVMSGRSQPLALDRKASVGPCFRPAVAFGGPSGITICVPKKSERFEEDLKAMQSVINITVSKKCLINKSTSRTHNENGKKDPGQEQKDETCNLKVHDVPRVNCLSFLRGKINNMRRKIRDALNI